MNTPGEQTRLSQVLHKLSDSVSDLNANSQVSALKIQRLEESIIDIKDVLSRLSDIYNSQVLLQKDITHLNKEIMSIKSSTQRNTDDIIPIRNTLQNQINAANYGLKVIGFVSAILYGIAGFFYNHTTEYIKRVDSRLEVIESKVHATTSDLDSYIKKMEWIHPNIRIDSSQKTPSP